MKSRLGLEEMVKQLQKELHERDSVISQLHEQMSVASFRTSPLNSPFVMSPGAGSPTGDQSPDRTPPLGMISHKKSQIMIFGHKHKILNFDQNFDNFHEKNFNGLLFWFIFGIKFLILNQNS